MKTIIEERREAAEGMDYRGRRAVEYNARTPVGDQLGAIIDELRAMREGKQAQSFTDLLAKIDAIKAEVPKS